MAVTSPPTENPQTELKTRKTMKKALYLLAGLVLLVSVNVSARSKTEPKRYVIGFYNLENLFDTLHDEGKNDEAFLPDGANQWTEEKYRVKQHNMATVIDAMRDENQAWHAVLGVSEIENRHVLEDLVAQPEIAPAGFRIVHYEGPDRRGIDVALLYRPDEFEVIESKAIPYDFNSPSIVFSMSAEEQAAFRTRDVLMVRGLLGGEMFAFFVAHLPSRLGEKSGDLRSRGAEIIYLESRRLMQEYPGIQIVVMGDMNDNPTDDSMAVQLRGKEKIRKVRPADFFSPFLSMYKNGYSSLYYRGEGNIYDLILVNSTLAKAPKGTLKIRPITDKKYYGRVFHRPFMTQQEGPYAGTPFRTFSGGKFIGGYSDHYPTYIIVSNQ